MPYTRLWDETNPPGTALAASLDTIIQNFKTDTRERVAGIFGLNLAEFTADPIVPKSLSLSVGYTGNMTGNVTGNVTGNLTGTVLTAAQPNITSLGTLTNLDIAGKVTIGSPLSLVGFVAGDLLFAKNTSIRRANNAGTTTQRVITFGGNDDVVYFAADGQTTQMQGSLIVVGTLTGTLATAAQPNITSLGTLTGLTVNGVTSTTGTTGSVYHQLLNTGNTTYLLLESSVGGSAFGGAAYQTVLGNVSARSLSFATNSIIRQTIDSAGNVVFSGTVTAANFVGPTSIDANALTGTTLAANVVNSSLTSVGTLTSLTVAGALQVNTRIKMTTAVGTSAAGEFAYHATVGTYIWGKAGSGGDFTVFNNAGTQVFQVPTGTTNVVFASGITGNLTGTILTAAQGNITSLGTLVNLSVTGAITSNASVNVNSVSGIIDIYASSGGHFNWRIRKSDTVANWLQFTPSTAADGLTFTTPTFNLVHTGQVLIGTTSLTGVAAGGIHVAGGSVFDSSLAVNASFLMTGGEAKYIATASGTNGTGIFSRWYRDDGTTVKGGFGYFSNDSIVFTVGSRIASGTTVLTTGAATVAITLNSDASVTYVGAVNGITTLTATTLIGNLTGTINTSAQGNITSLGTLTSLTVSGLSTFGTGHISQGASTSVGAVTTIYTVPSNSGGIVLVYGSDGTNIFIDEVLVGDTAASVALAHQFTIAGAPATRTYSMSSGLLRLAMGSGTYTIKTMPFYVN